MIIIVVTIVVRSGPARAAGAELAPIPLAGSKGRRRRRFLARDGRWRGRVLTGDRWWRRILARNRWRRGVLASSRWWRRVLAGDGWWRRSLARHGRRRWWLAGHRGWRGRSLARLPRGRRWRLTGNGRRRRRNLTGLAGGRRWWRCPVLPLARPSSGPEIGVLARRRSSLDDDIIGRRCVARGELGGLEGTQGHEIVDFYMSHLPSAFRIAKIYVSVIRPHRSCTYPWHC